MITLGLELGSDDSCAVRATMELPEKGLISSMYTDEFIFSCQHIVLVFLRPGNPAHDISDIFIASLRRDSSPEGTISLNLILKNLKEICALIHSAKSSLVRSRDTKRRIIKLTNLGRERNSTFQNCCNLLVANFDSLLDKAAVASVEVSEQIVCDLKEELASLSPQNVF